MALSLLQDAQTRGLAAALAGMKRDEERSLSMSPPMSTNPSSMYSGLHPVAAASALGMLSPQLLAANRTAAALMAARLPMSTLATSLFPHHPALFGAWPQPSPVPPMNGPHSPPASPLSPIMSSKKLSHHTNNNTHSKNNNLLSPTTGEVPNKKPRKINVKKEFMSPHTQSIDIPDVYPTGPISPPSSGSSPNSTHDVPVVSLPKDPSRDKCFTCKICNRSFGYKHVLQNHERTHTGEKPFKCPECQKRFTRDHHLKTHMRLHTGEKPYECSHCDRKFVQVANLRRHLRVHTGERPYSCNMCEARFSDSNQLKSHNMIHDGEKPFECDRCHLKFRRRHHLMHHKCGIQSPPTPALSPAISEMGMSDHKSAASSSFGSEESNDRLKSALSMKHLDDLPLDLSDDRASHNISRSTVDSDKQGSKLGLFRQIPVMEEQLLHCNLPEQTEPEDLSIRSPRSGGSVQSPPSSHHDDPDDLEDLDDAAALYMELQKKERASLLNHIRTPYSC
ncbi:unnamed protein product [Hermetia illucens]|uniref:C2H2-type domain-containing protein n=1 Tax=Hermetia illucens TaxID=343691 RepID=A0A7R8UZM9_HERIL|nr:protein krueppel [Hermetia illucens]CAD7088884.1 unnamed protein product [Hermetia illucens]